MDLTTFLVSPLSSLSSPLITDTYPGISQDPTFALMMKRNRSVPEMLTPKLSGSESDEDSGLSESLTHFSDLGNEHLQTHREMLLQEVDDSIQSLLTGEEFAEILSKLTFRPLFPSSAEFFLATISGLGFVETTRSYKENLAARSTSTYPVLDQQRGRAGDPICDYYYARAFGSATIVALADGCNWGERPQAAAIAGATSFVRYLQDRLHLLSDTHQTAKAIVNGFAVAHQAICKSGPPRGNSWELGTSTLLGGILIPIANAASPLQSRRQH
jgi:hypothetical protein